MCLSCADGLRKETTKKQIPVNQMSAPQLDAYANKGEYDLVYETKDTMIRYHIDHESQFDLVSSSLVLIFIWDDVDSCDSQIMLRYEMDPDFTHRNSLEISNLRNCTGGHEWENIQRHFDSIVNVDTLPLIFKTAKGATVRFE